MAEEVKHPVETAPDPEEDDLDDLDDVLDEFNPTASSSEPPPSTAAPTADSTASGPSRPDVRDTLSAQPPGDANLTAQLQQGMAGLMSELDSNPDMQAQFEKMMQELIATGAVPTDKEADQHLQAAVGAAPKVEDNGIAATGAIPKDTAAATKPGKAGGFDDTIRRTMERMQASDAAAASSTSAPQTEEALLEQMMKELVGGGGGEGGEEDFNKMLLNMMSQLTNREILYEPMKELHDKFPTWLETHQEELAEKGAEGAADTERYKGQQRVVGEIVARFERKGYSDDNEGDREYIVERMQKVSMPFRWRRCDDCTDCAKMQALGSPPADLVGDMSEMAAATEALGDMDQGCPTQ